MVPISDNILCNDDQQTSKSQVVDLPILAYCEGGIDVKRLNNKC